MLDVASVFNSSFFWALSIGTVKFPLAVIYNAVTEQFTSTLPIESPGHTPIHDIIWLLRMPRLVLVLLLLVWA